MRNLDQKEHVVLVDLTLVIFTLGKELTRIEFFGATFLRFIFDDIEDAFKPFGQEERILSATRFTQVSLKEIQRF